MFDRNLNSSFSVRPWAITKTILACITFLLFINQLYSASNIIRVNSQEPPRVSYADMEGLSAGQEVCGTIDSIFYKLGPDGDNKVSFYLLRTPNNKLVPVMVPLNSDMDSKLDAVYKGELSSVDYKAKVGGASDLSKGFMNLLLISSNKLINSGIEGNAQQFITDNMLSLTDYEFHFSDKTLVATFVGAALMLLATILLLRKNVKDMIYGYKVSKGEIKLDLLKAEDLTFENVSTYQGNEELQDKFYVNTDYDIYDKNNKNGKYRNEIQQDNGTEQKVNDQRIITDDEMFYESSVNEDGNFYVKKDDPKPDRVGFGNEEDYTGRY